MRNTSRKSMQIIFSSFSVMTERLEIPAKPCLAELEGGKNGNVYYGKNEAQYNMAYTANGKLLYIEKLANAIINQSNVE